MKIIGRLMAIAGLLAGAASLVFAAAAPQKWETLSKESQFQQLKPGDKIVYVCAQCKTVTEKTITSAQEAMEHCTDGTLISCPSCKAKVKIVSKGPPKNQTTTREVTYVNEKGEECFFVAKVIEAK